MSERASGVLVGAFVVGALVIAVAGALFVAGGGFYGERGKIVMVFDGSIRGLTVGAPLALRGVTIGQVTDVDVMLDVAVGDVTMAVVAEIDRRSMELVGTTTETLIEELVELGLRAQLDTQSLLTGLLYIQLDFHPNREPVFADLESPYAQIPTIPTEFEQLRESFEAVNFAKISESMQDIATGLDDLLNNPDMQALPGALRGSLGAIETASASLQRMVDDNSIKLSGLLDGGALTLQTLNNDLPAITAEFSSSLQRFDALLESADKTMEQVGNAAAPDSPTRRQLSNALHDFSLASRALRSLARSLEEHPESLLRGRQVEEIE